jgi:hypothetical protein
MRSPHRTTVFADVNDILVSSVFMHAQAKLASLKRNTRDAVQLHSNAGRKATEYIEHIVFPFARESVRKNILSTTARRGRRHLNDLSTPEWPPGLEPGGVPWNYFPPDAPPST